MSSFYCDKCGALCSDTPRGYVTGCEHYPAKVGGPYPAELYLARSSNGRLAIHERKPERQKYGWMATGMSIELDPTESVGEGVKWENDPVPVKLMNDVEIDDLCKSLGIEL